jgi:hypothetical protein
MIRLMFRAVSTAAHAVNKETRATSCTNGLTGSGTVENRTVTCTSGGGVTYGPWTRSVTIATAIL